MSKATAVEDEEGMPQDSTVDWVEEGGRRKKTDTNEVTCFMTFTSLEGLGIYVQPVSQLLPRYLLLLLLCCAVSLTNNWR